MKEVGNIYLSWRNGIGHRRHVVGIIKRNSTDGVRFSYDIDSIEKAKKEGFVTYTEFPDINKEYKDNVLEIFGQRITKSERSDINDFYSFWEIDTQFKEDKYYMLAHTQGMLPTDNFEFLADYNPISELKFSTDLAGVSHLQLVRDSLAVGDILRWEKEPNNIIDKEAIKVFKGDLTVGYIKKIHCKVFHKKNGDKLKLSVKNIDQNGIIKRIFVKVSF